MQHRGWQLPRSTSVVWRIDCRAVSRLAGSLDYERHYFVEQDVDPLCWYPAPACDGTAGTTYRACFGPAALWNALSFDYMQSILLMCLPDPLPDAAGLQTRLHLSGRAYSGRCSVLISAGPAQTARYGHFSYTAGAHSAPHIPCRTLLMPWRGPPHIYCCGRGFQMYSTPSACVVS